MADDHHNADTKLEKGADNGGAHVAVETELHEHSETEGYVIDSEGSQDGYKLAKDGHTRLIPQPSDDPNDPLNWSWGIKHFMLFIVALTAFLPDFGSAIGAVTLLPQALCVSSPLPAAPAARPGPRRPARLTHLCASTGNGA